MTTGVIRKGPLSARRTQVPALILSGLSKEVRIARNGRLYGGDAGYCSRKNVLYCAVPEDMTTIQDPASEFYFKVGNAYHDIVKASLLKQKLLLAAEYRIPEMGLNIGGKIDVIMNLEGAANILELKTCGALPSSPKPNHKAQALIYHIATGLPAHVVYISRTVADYKGNVNMVSFSLDTSHEEIWPILMQATLSHVYLQAEQIPPRPSFIMDEGKDCQYCPFTAICWHGEPLPGAMDEVSAEDQAKLFDQAEELANKLLEEMPTRKALVLKSIRAKA